MSVLRLFRRIITLIIVLSSLLAGWTTFALLNKSTFDKEINSVLREIYSNQVSFLGNIKDLSVLLVKETTEIITNKKIDNISSTQIESQESYSSKERSLSSSNIEDEDSDLLKESNSLKENNLKGPISIMVEPSE